MSGASDTSAYRWANRIGQIYRQRCATCFGLQRQLNMVADGSTHSCKDILVSVAWQPNLEVACFCQIQQVTVGVLDPSEINLQDVLEQVIRVKKLERLSAYRQLQAISHQISLLTDNRMTLESFRIPDTLARGPVSAGETRVRKRAAAIRGVVPDASAREGEAQGDAPEAIRGVVPDASAMEGEIQGDVPTHQSFVQRCDGTNVPVLPTEPRWWLNIPILVLGLDQGAIGMAGMAFAAANNMIHVKFDKIHRAVRDYKNSIGHCLSGIFLKTQLHSAYIFSLNHKPFGSGAFWKEKQNMMNVFLQTQSILSDVWLEFRDGIRDDLLGFGSATASDARLFDMISELNSFNKKGSLVKLSRWFSWNEACKEQLPEFHVFKMLLKYTYENSLEEKVFRSIRPRDKRMDVNLSSLDKLGIRPEAAAELSIEAIQGGLSPGHVTAPAPQDDATEDIQGDKNLLRQASKQKLLDPKKELSLLKKTLGGFKLAYHLMTEDLFDHCRILYRVTQPLWTWYADQVQRVQNPADGIQYQIEMSAGGWQSDDHLRQIVAVLNDSELITQLRERGLRQPVLKVLSLTLHLLKNRSWSLSRHSLPPEAFAGILSERADTRRSAAKLLATQHRALLAFEAALANNRTASEQSRRLWSDLQVGVSHPARLVMDTFEAFGYASEEETRGVVPPAIHVLKAVLSNLPDSKIVEDIHNKIRTDSRLNKNSKQTDEHIQDITVCSGVFETRRIEHRAEVNKEAFLKDFPRTQARKMKSITRSKTHKLPAVWSQILGRKTWQTLSEETLEKASAAWNWMQYYSAAQLGKDLVSLSDGVFSKLCPAFVVLNHTVSRSFWLSLGPGSWAALMWPLRECEDDWGSTYFMLDPNGSVAWKFLYRPLEWDVLETQAVLWKDMVCLKFCHVQNVLPAHCSLSAKQPDMFENGLSLFELFGRYQIMLVS